MLTLFRNSLPQPFIHSNGCRHDFPVSVFGLTIVNGHGFHHNSKKIIHLGCIEGLDETSKMLTFSDNVYISKLFSSNLFK